MTEFLLALRLLYFCFLRLASTNKSSDVLSSMKIKPGDEEYGGKVKSYIRPENSLDRRQS